MNIRNPSRLPGRVQSAAIIGPAGEPVIMIEAVKVRAGQQVSLVFESVGSPWRQGVFLATDGVLRVARQT